MKGGQADSALGHQGQAEMREAGDRKDRDGKT